MTHPGDEEGAAGQEPAPLSAPLDETIDALRSALTEEPAPESWRRDIALIGVMMAVFGSLAWYAIISDRAAVPVAELQVVSALPARDAWIRPGFEQVMSAYMQAGQRLRLREPNELRASALINSAPVFGLGRATSAASWRIQAELTADPESSALTVNLTLTSLADSEPARTTTLSGDITALTDIAARGALQVFDWLEIDPFEASEQAAAAGDLPSAPGAAAPYALGLQALQRGEGRRALDLLETALAQSPDHPMINAAVGEAYDFLGYQSRGVEHLERAYTLRTSLTREKQLSIEARLRYLQGRWQDAEDLYAALVAFHPESLSYGLALADALFADSRQDAAWETLADLRANPSFQDDPRIDLKAAYFWRHLGDWKKGHMAAEQAANRAEALGYTGILGRALVAYADMRGDQTAEALRRARDLFQALGDPYGKSMVLRELGDSYYYEGELSAAASYYEQSLDVSSEVGNEAEIATAQQSLAIVYDLRGSLQEGHELKQSVLESYQRRGIYRGAAVMLENIGISLFKMGRLDEAEAAFAEALIEFETHGDAIGVAWWPYHQGRILVGRGNLQPARTLFEEALLNAERHPEGSLELHTRYELAQLDFFEQHAEAEATLAAVADAYAGAKLQLDYGATRVLQARLAHLKGHSKQAQTFTAEAIQIFEESRAGYYLASARAHGIRQGDLSMCEPLREQVPGFQHREAALIAHAALTRCSSDNPPAAELLDEAQRLGLFEAQLALTGTAQPAAAQALAAERGWTAPEYW